MNIKTTLLLLLLAITGTIFCCHTCTTNKQYVPPLSGEAVHPLKEIRLLQQNEKRYNNHIRQLEQESNTLKQQLEQSLEQLAIKRIQYKKLATHLLEETAREQPDSSAAAMPHTQVMLTQLETTSAEKDAACDSALVLQDRLLAMKDSAIAYTGRQYHLASILSERVLKENRVLTGQLRKQKRTATFFKLAATVLAAVFLSDKLSPD